MKLNLRDDSRSELRFLECFSRNKALSPISANPTTAGELFECVWPFCEVGA